jgi:hypothetical protein
LEDEELVWRGTAREDKQPHPKELEKFFVHFTFTVTKYNKFKETFTQ